MFWMLKTQNTGVYAVIVKNNSCERNLIYYQHPHAVFLLNPLFGSSTHFLEEKCCHYCVLPLYQTKDSFCTSVLRSEEQNSGGVFITLSLEEGALW